MQSEAQLMAWYRECWGSLATLYPTLSVDAIRRVASRWIIADLNAAMEAKREGRSMAAVAAGTIDRMKAAYAAEVAQ